MKLFTFSGISASISGVNLGLGLRDMARNLISDWPDDAPPAYSGIDGTDHFHSNVNNGQMLAVFEDAVRLNGVGVLNEESNRRAPDFAKAMREATAADSSEAVLILAHSQGTNNLTRTLLYLATNHPDFYIDRAVRCVLFDPKVGSNYVSQAFGLFAKDKLSFLFLQSERDLLGNQGMNVPKFISQFVLGDHIWIRGLDHGTIREWASLNKPQRWLNRPGFMTYEQLWKRKENELKQETHGGQLGTMQLLRLDKWTAKYAKDEMNLDKPSDALLAFLQGRLPARFKS